MILNIVDIYWCPCEEEEKYALIENIVKLHVFALRLGVDFTFTLDNNDNHNNDNLNNDNPHLNFFKGTRVRDKGQVSRDKT